MDHEGVFDECLLWSIPLDGVYQGITDADAYMPGCDEENVWTDGLMIRRLDNDAMLRDMERAYSECGIGTDLELINVQPVPEGIDTGEYFYQGTFVARFKW